MTAIRLIKCFWFLFWSVLADRNRIHYLTLYNLPGLPRVAVLMAIDRDACDLDEFVRKSKELKQVLANTERA